MSEEIKIVNVKELKKWIDNNEAIIVDVREVDEYAQGHIDIAVNIPLKTISLDKIKDNFKNLTDKKIVMQCRSGVRSMSACVILQEQVIDNEVYNLEGGILAWSSAGYDINR